MAVLAIALTACGGNAANQLPDAAAGGVDGGIDGRVDGGGAVDGGSGVDGGGAVDGGAAVLLTRIDVTPTDPQIPAGETQALTATGTFSDTSTRDLTDQVAWSSDTPAHATVSNLPGSRGVVTAVAPGAAQIAASLDGVTARTAVTVTPVVLLSITVAPAAVQLAVGLDQAYQATGQYSDASTRNLTNQVTWDVVNPAIATFLPSEPDHGLLQARAVGQTQVRARLDGVTGTADLTVTPVAVLGLEVLPSFSSFPANLAVPFTARKEFTDGTSVDVTAQVTWSSSDEARATISNADDTRGVVTTRSPGSVVIRAVLGDLTGETNLQVTTATLNFISIPVVPNQVPVGLTVALTASGLYSDGSTLDLTSQVTWTSDNLTVATVSNAAGSHGVVTGVTVGATVITATFTGVHGSRGFGVTNAVPVAIALTPASPQLALGRTVQLAAVGTLSDGSVADVTTECSWASSNTLRATVTDHLEDKGLVTAVGVGTVQITATAGIAVGTTTVTVTPAALDRIDVVNTRVPIPIGSTMTFPAIGVFSDGTSRNLFEATWSSDNPAVASAGPGGMVTAHALGTAVITAAADGVTGSTMVTVSPAALASLVITPNNPNLPLGRSVQLAVTGTFTDGAIQDLTAQATWTSSIPANATVSNTGVRGLVTTLQRGGTTIRASFAGVFGEVSVTITAPVLDAIAIAPAQASVAVGGTQAFTARGTFSDASTLDLTGQVAWTSSAPGVATISSIDGSRGVATGVAAGMTSITASLGNVTSLVPATLTVSP